MNAVRQSIVSGHQRPSCTRRGPPLPFHTFRNFRNFTPVLKRPVPYDYTHQPLSVNRTKGPPRMHRLGVVSFLNARPLIAGLDADPHITLRFDVPARLPALLDAGEVDAALVPVVDVLRSAGRYRIISDGCIGCDGETMTVRVFSQVPPDRVKTLHVDGDSHTSVMLARVLWQELYGRNLELHKIDAASTTLDELQSVLLIGDKVINPQRGSFAYEVDLGGAWRQLTGLPFVFALWAAPADAAGLTREWHELAALLAAARDLGVQQAAQIADELGPTAGWPTPLARRYLTRCLRYTLDERAQNGMRHFAELCTHAGLLPRDARVDDLTSRNETEAEIS